jgi:hypothetical protein
MSRKDNNFYYNDYVSLKEFLVDKIDELKEYLDVKINASEKAKDTAYASMEKRLEGMNEFRDTLKDQAAKFVTRDELASQLERINILVKSLELSKATLEGKANQSSVNVAMIFSILGTLIGLISLASRFIQ